MRFRGAAALLLVLAALGLAAPAEAETYSHRDGTADVARLGGECSPCQGTDRPDADVLRFAGDYDRDLRLTLTLGAVPRRGSAGWLVRYGGRRWLSVFVHLDGPRQWCSTLRWDEKTSREVPCARLDASVDRETGVLRATVPPAWFGSPARVKLGAGSITEARGDLYLDDGLRRNFDPTHPGLYLSAGPSIGRG
jgi:hypothetical protein